MRKSGLDEAQAGIKIAGRNIKNLRYAYDTTFMAESEKLKSFVMKVKEKSENKRKRYADDTTLMAESEQELKSLLMKVKEESEKADLKLTSTMEYYSAIKKDNLNQF